MDIRWLLVLGVLLIFAERQLYRTLGLRKVTYRRMFSKSVVEAGEDLHMVEIIENGKWLPIPWVILEATFDIYLMFQTKLELNVRQGERFQNHRSYFSLGPHTRVTRRHTLRGLRRGIYRIDSAAMTCGDIFGMQVTTYPWKLAGEGTVLTVLPRVRTMDDLAIPAHSWLGDIVVRRWIQPDPFIRAGSRPYQSGDSLGQINWKATARTGALQVHQQEFTADYRIMLVLNFEVMEDMWDQVTEPDRMEAGIVLAASIAAHFVRQGIPVGFVCNAPMANGEPSDIIAPAAGEAHLQSLLVTLAGLRLQVDVGFAELLEGIAATQPHHTDYVIVSGYVNHRIQAPIDAMIAMGNAVEVVPLPSDDEVADFLSIPSQSEMNPHAG